MKSLKIVILYQKLKLKTTPSPVQSKNFKLSKANIKFNEIAGFDHEKEVLLQLLNQKRFFLLLKPDKSFL